VRIALAGIWALALLMGLNLGVARAQEGGGAPAFCPDCSPYARPGRTAGKCFLCGGATLRPAIPLCTTCARKMGICAWCGNRIGAPMPGAEKKLEPDEALKAMKEASAKVFGDKLLAVVPVLGGDMEAIFPNRVFFQAVFRIETDSAPQARARRAGMVAPGGLVRFFGTPDDVEAFIAHLRASSAQEAMKIALVAAELLDGSVIREAKDGAEAPEVAPQKDGFSVKVSVKSDDGKIRRYEFRLSAEGRARLLFEGREGDDAPAGVGAGAAKGDPKGKD